MVNKIFASVFVIFCVVQFSSGSAIPIWELLGRGEKMSHLYSTFAYLVSDYCKTNSDARSTPTAKCKRELLAYGLSQLQGMSNHQLDILDPYQRGANEIVWEAIMRNHPTVKTSPPRIPPLTISSSPSVIYGSSGSNSQKNPIFEDEGYRYGAGAGSTDSAEKRKSSSSSRDDGSKSSSGDDHKPRKTRAHHKSSKLVRPKSQFSSSSSRTKKH